MSNDTLFQALRQAAENLIKVKNLNGTADLKCKSCGSWIEHWKHKSKEEPDGCSCLGCQNIAEVGAHVKKIDSEDMHHYIVPLCKQCNAKTEEFWINKDVLVTARKCNPNK